MLEKAKALNFFDCSAPHTLLVMGKVDPLHPDLMVDPLNILRPHTKLTHQLPLVTLSSSSSSSSSSSVLPFFVCRTLMREFCFFR